MFAVNKIFRSVLLVLAALALICLGPIFASPLAGTPPLFVALSQPEPAVTATVTPAASHVAKSIVAPQPDLAALPVPAAIITDPSYEPFGSYLYIPSHAQERQPLQVVIALHGMGGEGRSFSATMIKNAEQYGWVLLAPTIAYGDWHNPQLVAAEDIVATRRLIGNIDALSVRTGLTLKPRVDVYGFSRGAQLAHRFAIFFPERVDRVVAFSAGTYTLPYGTRAVPGNGGPDAIPMPYGVSDLQLRLGHPVNQARLRQVQFLIGVGGADNAPGDVPREWDEYLGNTRLERALEFTRALQRSGVPCALKVYPSVGHEFTQLMLNTAVSFFTVVVPTVSPQLQ